jgi:hypothetical protein
MGYPKVLEACVIGIPPSQMVRETSGLCRRQA